jgi:uncharacterized OB-fold protein
MTRAAAMLPMDRAAAAGRVALQHCAACGAAQYPPRELCRVCLSAALDWTEAAQIDGEVLATTELAHSFEPDQRARLPLRIGLVQLPGGVRAVCFVPQAPAGASVTVGASLDAAGRAILPAESAS